MNLSCMKMKGLGRMDFTPRTQQILEILLGGKGPVSKQEIADRLGVSKRTIQREFGAFEKITDASPKYVLSLDRIDLGHNGIEHFNIVDFLLHKVNLHIS